MKKLLGIVVLGLLLGGCSTTQEYAYAGMSYKGKNGTLYEGMSKIQFCKIELPSLWIGACQSKSKYLKNGIEVHEYNRRYAIFKKFHAQNKHKMSDIPTFKLKENR